MRKLYVIPIAMKGIFDFYFTNVIGIVVRLELKSEFEIKEILCTLLFLVVLVAHTVPVLKS